MPRPIRKHLQNVTYDCYSRCIELRSLMSSSQMKKIASDVIDRALDKYSFELNHIVISNNHMHIRVTTLNCRHTISRIMQFIKSQIALKINRIMGRIGPLWNERFKSIIIEEAVNPIKTFFHLLFHSEYSEVRSKIVDDPRKNRFGAINYYLNEWRNSEFRIKLHKYYMDLGDSLIARVFEFEKLERLYVQSQ